MNGSHITPTRRAVIGAFALAPLAAAPAAAVTIAGTNARAWDTAMARYEAAKHISDEHTRNIVDPLFAEQDRIWGEKHIFPTDPRHAAYVAWREEVGFNAACTECERLVAIECDAEEAVMAMPAPHGAAVLWKLNKLFGPAEIEPDGMTPSWSITCAGQFFDDVRRLAGAA